MARVGAAAVLLAAAGMIGQLAALARELFVAAQVGASIGLDALLVALVLPILVSGIIAGSLRTAVVPAYLRLVESKGRDIAQQFLGAVLTWATIGAVLSVLFLAVMPAVGLAVAGPGLSEAGRVQAAAFLPLVLPILALSVLSHLLSAICQIADRYRPIAVALLVAPVVSLMVTLIGWERAGLTSVALGLTVGHAVSVVALLAFAARAHLLPPVTLRAGRSDLGEFVRHAVPLTVGSAVLQFNLVADRAIATLMTVGSVSVLKFGQQLVTEPLGSLASAWTTAVYPALVRTGQAGGQRGLGSAATVALRYGLAIFVPVSVGVAALAPLIVDVVYQRGAFDSATAFATSQVVVGFAPMLTLVMLQPIITGAHNTRRRGLLLGTTAVANAVSNIALNLVLGRLLGVAGIALSTSLTVAILLAFLCHRLAVSEPDFDLRSVGYTACRALAASAVPGVAAATIAWTLVPDMAWPGNLLALVGTAAGGLVLYVLLAAIIRMEEPVTLMRWLASARTRRVAP